MDNNRKFPCWNCRRMDCKDLACGLDRCTHCRVTADEAILHGHAPHCPNHVPEPVEDGVYLVRASDLKPEHVDYLEEDLIPLRVVTLTTGLDGVGKSTILYHKAALATGGRLPGKFKGTPVDVVIASSEDHPESVILPRLIAAGADLDRVHIVKVRRHGLTGDISLPDDLDAVATEVGSVRARLLIVDPLVAHMPLNIDSHKAQHVRQVLTPLARLAEAGTLAVAAVVHFNGSPSNDVRSRISGSKALRDAARSVLVCGPDPADESRYVVVQDKHSFGPRSTTGSAYRIETRLVDYEDRTYKTSGVVWLGSVEIDSRRLLAGPDEERADRDDAADFLRTVLAHGGRPPKEVEQEGKAAGFSVDQLKRAKPRAGVRSRKGDFDGQWIWELNGAEGSNVISQGSEERTSRTDAPFTPLEADAPEDVGARVSESDIQELLEQELGATVVEERRS